MWGGGTGNPWNVPPPQHQMPQQQQPPQIMQNNHWSLNPNHYADVPNNQVDWAALAQQWIMLKGANGSSSGPPGPQDIGGGMMNIRMGQASLRGPPPIQQQQHHHHMLPHPHQMIGNNQHMNNLRFHQPHVPPNTLIMQHPGIGIQRDGNNIQGANKIESCDNLEEAPMDVEPAAEGQDLFKSNRGSNWKSTTQTNWYAPENNNPWNSSVKTATIVTAVPSAVNLTGYTTAPTPPPPSIHKGHHHSIHKDKKTHPTLGYQTNLASASAYQDSTSSIASHDTSSYPGSGGYWSTSDNSGDGTPLSSYYTGNHSVVAPTHVSGYSSDDNSMPDFDAAKRKALPPWIREGLEKMEREKQKKEEKARKDAEREEDKKRRLAEHQQKMSEDEGQSVTESKWTADNESREPSSDEENDDLIKLPPPVKPKLTLHNVQDIIKNAPEHLQEELTRYCVRYLTTKVLLKGTNELIHDAAIETLHLVRTRTKRKKVTSSAMHVKKLGALASITGGALGLGEYGSDSEQSDDSNKSDEEDPNDSDDSDADTLEAEIIAEMERKKRDWELKLLDKERKRDNSRSRSRSAGPHVHESSPAKKEAEDNVQHESHGREKREVEKTSMSNDAEDSDKLKSRNGRRKSSESDSHSTSRRDNEKVDKSDGSKVKKASSSSSSKKRDRSKSKDRSHKEKDYKRRSPLSSSRHTRKKSRSRSRSRRRKSRSESRQRRSRSGSRHRRRRSRSPSSSKNHKRRHSSKDGKNRKARSKSRDRKTSISKEKDKKVESVKSKEKSKRESGRKKGLRSSRSVSKSRSDSSDSHKKEKKKKRKKRSKSTSSDASDSGSSKTKHKK